MNALRIFFGRHHFNSLLYDASEWVFPEGDSQECSEGGAEVPDLLNEESWQPELCPSPPAGPTGETELPSDSNATADPHGVVSQARSASTTELGYAGNAAAIVPEGVACPPAVVEKFSQISWGDRPPTPGSRVGTVQPVSLE